MKTAWGQFRDFINSKEIGYVFTRQKIQDKLPHINTATIDGYRSLVQQGKFIERVGRGQYKLLSHLPENLTMGSLSCLLRGDNLTYIENIEKQKEFKILKEKFLQERDDIIIRVIRGLLPLIEDASTIESPAFGLKNLCRNLRWELNKMPNPTKIWLRRQK